MVCTRPLPKIVALENKRRPTLGGAQIRVGKQNEDNVTALRLHRRSQLRGVPNLRRMFSIGHEDRRLALC